MPRKLNLAYARYYFSWLKSFGDGDWETSEVGDFVTEYMLGHPYRKYCNHLNQIKSGLNGCNFLSLLKFFSINCLNQHQIVWSQICIDLLLQQDGAWSKPQRLQAFCYGIHNMDHTQQYLQFRLYSFILNYTQFF